MKKIKLYAVIALVVLLATLLPACAPQVPAPFVPGSILICPKNYEPGVSTCREKQQITAENMNTPQMNSLTEQEYAAVLLQANQVAIFQVEGNSYGIYKDPGYQPVPNDYARIYPTDVRYVTSDYKPDEACGGNNEISCLKSLTDITMKGPKMFEASYVFAYTLNFGNPASYKTYYEAETERGLKGYDAFMVKYNDDFRNTLRASNAIDPTPWLDSTKSDGDIKPYWLDLLANDPDMAQYKDLVILDEKEFDIRYFKQVVVKVDDQVQSNDVLEQQKWDNTIKYRDQFCSEFPAGSELRLQCYNTFTCLEVKCSAIVNNALRSWELDMFSTDPTATSAP